VWVGLQADAFPSMQQDPSSRNPTHEIRALWVGLQADAFPSMQQDPSGRSPTPIEKSIATANRERGIIAHPARRSGRPLCQLSRFRTE